VSGSDRFERPRGRRADGDNAAASRERRSQRRRGRFVNFVLLGLESVILDLFDPNRLKRAYPTWRVISATSTPRSLRAVTTLA
jgi:hypothetical protein